MTRREIAGVRGGGPALKVDGDTAIRFSDLRARRLAASPSATLELTGCALRPGTLDGVAHASRAGCYTQAESWRPEAADAADRLLDGDNAERAAAARELGELGDAEAAGLLGYALTDPEWEVRAAALDALGALRGAAFPFADPELVAWMALRLGDEIDAVQARAWAALQAVRPDVVAAAAAEALGSADPETVRAGLAAVDRLLGEPTAAHAMLRAIRAARVRELVVHPDGRVRAAALGVLGRLRGPGDAELALEALDDPDAAVRTSAVTSLRSFGRAEDAEAAARLSDDEHEAVRLAALTTVAALAGREAPALDRARVDPSPRVRHWADVLSGGGPAGSS